LLLLRLAFNDLGYFLKVMARCSPIDEIAIVNVAEAENPDIVDDPMEMARVIGAELPKASDGEGPALSAEGVETFTGASDDEHSWTYYFGSSTITRGKIKEMVEKGYFIEGEAREPRAETILEPEDDEAVIFDFFYRRFTHASTSCFGRHSAKLPGVAAPVDAQCDGTTL
jgi:hypothetical protein